MPYRIVATILGLTHPLFKIGRSHVLVLVYTTLYRVPQDTNNRSLFSHASSSHTEGTAESRHQSYSRVVE